MSIMDSLLDKTCDIYSVTALDQWNKRTQVKTYSAKPCRFEITENLSSVTLKIGAPKESTIIIQGKLYLSPEVLISTDDEVIVSGDSKTYKVAQVIPAPLIDGTIDHLEVLLL